MPGHDPNPPPDDRDAEAHAPRRDDAAAPGEAAADSRDTSPPRPQPTGFLLGQASWGDESSSPAADDPDDRQVQGDEPAAAHAATLAARPTPARFLSRPTSRELMLFWCVFLLASLAISQQLDLYGLTARWMVFACLFGMTLIWPVVRLSQDASVPMWRHEAAPADAAGESPAPAAHNNSDGDDDIDNNEADRDHALPRAHYRSRLTAGLIFRDWLWLVAVFQFVIWPMHYSAGWSVEQVAWLDGAVTAWCLLVGAFVALGCRASRGGPRLAAMLAVLVIILGEPIATVLLSASSQAGAADLLGQPMRLSPVEAVYRLTVPAVRFDPRPSDARILTVAAAALVGWLGLIVWSVAARRRALGLRA